MKVKSVSHIKGRIWAGGVREWGAEKDIWSYEGGNDRRVEQIRSEGLHTLSSSPNNIRIVK
jgi:hypothetical protein